MKYLLSIIGIVLLFSLSTAAYLWLTKVPQPQNIVLSINGHKISREELSEQESRQGYHSGTSASVIDSLVTKQLMLDEAQRLGIDREDAFRKSLKDYYEQSLIKVLTERKLKSVDGVVSEEDIDRYLARSGKICLFTRVPIVKGEAQESQGQQDRVLFDDLSESLRLVLATLLPGESVRRFETGTEVDMLRLDRLEVADDATEVSYNRARVRELLGDYRKGLAIDRWINGLRKKASIVVYREEEKDE